MAIFDTTSLVPYTRGPLEAALEIIRDQKAGLLDPANALDCHQKFGLRSRNNDATVSLLPMPFNDDDDTSDEDFDPAEEMRERMRELTRRKLALRNAEESDALSNNASARTEPLNVTFKFKLPMAKWILRSLDETGNEASALDPSGICDSVTVPSEPAACVISADNNNNAGTAVSADQLFESTGLISNAEHVTAGIVVDADENDRSPPSNGNYRRGRQETAGVDSGKGKEKVRNGKRRKRAIWATIARPAEAPDEPRSSFFLAEDGNACPRRKRPRHGPVASDPRLVNLLGLESEDVAKRHLAHMHRKDAEVESEDPATWLTEDNMRLAQEKYRIIPNIVSVKARRPRWLRGAAPG